MVFWPLLSMVFWPPLPMVYQTTYPWYIDHPTYGILTSLTMVYWHPLLMAYRPPYSWYFDLPTHGILTHPLPISWLEMRRVKIPWGFNLPYRGGGVFNKYTMDENLPRSHLPWGENTIWHWFHPQIKLTTTI
jgi:hypothetical protein